MHSRNSGGVGVGIGHQEYRPIADTGIGFSLIISILIIGNNFITCAVCVCVCVQFIYVKCL